MSMRERRRMLLATLGGGKVNLSTDNIPGGGMYNPGMGYGQIEILEDNLQIYSFSNSGYFAPVPVKVIEIKKGATVTLRYTSIGSPKVGITIYLNGSTVINTKDSPVTYSFIANGDVSLIFSAAPFSSKNYIDITTQ